MRCLLGFLAMLIGPACALAGTDQDLEAMRVGAARHLQRLARDAYPDAEVHVDVDKADPRLRLGHCDQPVFFLPIGNHAWGSGNLGVRCESPVWSLYLGFHIRLRGPALVTCQPLPANQRLSGNDLRLANIEYVGDPGRYPRDPDKLRGAMLTRPLPAGAPISVDRLRREPIIRSGQRVRIVAGGTGFEIGQDGIAQQQAAVGDSVRLKTMAGRVVQGIAQADGTVRVQP